MFDPTHSESSNRLSIVGPMSDSEMSPLADPSSGAIVTPEHTPLLLSSDSLVNKYLSDSTSFSSPTTIDNDGAVISTHVGPSPLSSDPFSDELLGQSQVGEMDRLTHARPKKRSRATARPTGRYRFGRLFPSLDPFEATDETLLLMGAPSNDSQNPAFMEDSQVRGTDNNAEFPVGMTYVGQLLTHDTSLDEGSILGQSNIPERVRNTATPWLDLDTIYKFDGKKAPRDPSDRAKLLMGNNLGNERDYARDSNGRALIVDRRNDENNNIAQVVNIFIQYHNTRVDELRAQGVKGGANKLFKRAKSDVVATWQSIIVNEWLPTFLKESVLSDIYENGRTFYTNKLSRKGIIPVEFGAAANRFGHSIVRGRYTLNEAFDRVRLFPLSEAELDRNLLGGRPIPAEQQIEWQRFFDFSDFGIVDPETGDQFAGLQVGRKIDRLVARPMLRLPIGGPGLPDFVLDQDNTVAGMPVVSLESLSLLRGKAFGLPSGQDIAAAMGFEPLTNEQFELNNPDEIILPEPLDEAPLLLYLLEEGRIQNDGQKLGDVGGRIVGEVIIGLLESDRDSILRKNQSFVSPITHTQKVTMADLIAHIGWIDVPDSANDGD